MELYAVNLNHADTGNGCVYLGLTHPQNDRPYSQPMPDRRSYSEETNAPRTPAPRTPDSIPDRFKPRKSLFRNGDGG